MLKDRHITTALFFLAGVGLLIGTVLCVHPAPTHAYRLPDTGQIRCYGNAGKEIACPAPGEPFYGQDGNYAGPQPAYRDNGDGTVTDLNTGLMWQQGDAQNNNSRTWQAALDYCDSLELANHTDWRLPNQLELMSIVNYGRYSPAVNISAFPNCRPNNYWSSSANVSNPGDSKLVGFHDGDLGWSNASSSFYVRCVRTGP